MKILLLTEGNILEDKIILSRIPSTLKIDRSNLSNNVSVINFFKYDLIIISFAPSFGTPHFRLIESLLKLNKAVISLNTDQNNFYFDYNSRSKSFEILCKLGLKLFVLDDNFENFISKLKLDSSKLKIDKFCSVNVGTDDIVPSDNLIFIFDFRWPTAPDKYFNYKTKVGYNPTSLRGALKYSTHYIECMSSMYQKIIDNLHFKKSYIYIDSFLTQEEIQIRFEDRFLKYTEIINEQKLIELIEENSVIVTNWHCIELIKYRENLKIFRLNFNYQKDIDYFKEIPTAQNFARNNLSALPDTFEICRIKSHVAVIDFAEISSILNHFKNISFDISSDYKNLAFDVSSFIFYTINLYLVQFRFLAYNLKNLIRLSYQ